MDTDYTFTVGRQPLADKTKTMHWPNRDTLRLYLLLGLALNVLFVVVYLGINLLTAHRDGRLRLYWDWELDIPLVQPMILVYFSILPLFLLPAFSLDAHGLKRLAKRMAAAIVAAGTVFLLLPAELGFARDANSGYFAVAFAFLLAVDLPHNLFPSLHVALSGLVIAALFPQSPAWARLLLGLWLVAICFAVVLVHQHHVADVPGGLLVAWACQRLLTGRAPA